MAYIVRCNGKIIGVKRLSIEEVKKLNKDFNFSLTRVEK